MKSLIISGIWSIYTCIRVGSEQDTSAQERGEGGYGLVWVRRKVLKGINFYENG